MISVYESRLFDVSQIDRGIFEAIRLRLVALGHLPNKPTLTTEQYATAKQSIPNLIEVFGVGGYEAKGELNYNHIIIDRVGEDDGDIRGSKAIDYETQTNGSFNKNVLPLQSNHINYTITVITQTVANERLIGSIIKSAIPQYGLLKGLNPDRSYSQNSFEIKRNGVVNLTLEPPAIEVLYQLRVCNVFLEPKVFLEEAVPLETINQKIGISNQNEALASNTNLI